MNISERLDEALFRLVPWDEVSKCYLAYHRNRYRYLIEILALLLNQEQRGNSGAPRILDVGPSHQTTLIKLLFPTVTLETMGYYNPNLAELETVVHTQCDLNHAASGPDSPSSDRYDLIVLCEVLEHLYTPPTKVLRMFYSLLRPGGLLLLQTPNPVSLMKRLLLLKGYSPFEIIRDDTTNPGHYCEYTLPDLLYLAKLSDYEVVQFSVKNYFGEPRWLYDLLCSMLPDQLGDGITLLLRRPLKDEPTCLNLDSA